MIRVKIPSLQKYELLQARKATGLDVENFLRRYMDLVVRDISFPCQPIFKYANASIEDGFMYADIDPETLPDYLSIKGSYEVIDSSLLELVTETLVGTESVDNGTMNHDNLISFKPKSSWDAQTVNAYLWALIRTVRSNNRLTLSGKNIIQMYMEELVKTKGIGVG